MEREAALETGFAGADGAGAEAEAEAEAGAGACLAAEGFAGAALAAAGFAAAGLAGADFAWAALGTGGSGACTCGGTWAAAAAGAAFFAGLAGFAGAGFREAGLADNFFSFGLGIGRGRISRTGHERVTIEMLEGQVKERCEGTLEQALAAFDRNRDKSGTT